MSYQFDPEAFQPFHDWHECTIDDACTIAALMGWDISPRDVQFSGFWSQGDGASFTGTLGYKAGCKRAVQEYAPLDTELHNIAARWQALQARHAYRYNAHVERNHYAGNYSHENTVTIADSYIGDSRYYGPDVPQATDESAIEIARDFMRWIYRRLESEYEYQCAWTMAQSWQDAAQEAHDSLVAAREALRDYRQGAQAGLTGSALATLKAAIRAALSDWQEACERFDTLSDEFHYYRDGRSMGIAEFATENL